VIASCWVRRVDLHPYLRYWGNTWTSPLGERFVEGYRNFFVSLRRIFNGRDKSRTSWYPLISQRKVRRRDPSLGVLL